ncbi:hypothetical protein [Streptomyces sp. NPDC047061]|uniref:hypothetical protein n=1 Tax=Streptomyces sp. NPDC047061 TaxID=3154605 RepID=UPI0033C4B015
MTDPPAPASGRVATGRSEGDLYPLPPGVPLAPAERPVGRPAARRPLPATPSE